MTPDTYSADVEDMLRRAGHPAAKPLQAFVYENADGEAVARGVFDGSRFKYQRLAADQWSDGVKGFVLPPYRQPEVIEALAHDRTVIVANSEKQADSLAARGLPATFHPGGADEWRGRLAECFRSADVVVLSNDNPDRKARAVKIAEGLSPTARQVRLVNVPQGASADWPATDRDADQLQRLIDQAAPYRPATRFPFVWFGEEHTRPQKASLVKGLLAQGELSVIFGPSGSGKSFVAIELGLCVAAGLPFFGRRTAQGGVVYVAGEGATGMLGRMTAWRLSGRAEGLPLPPLGMIPQALDLRTKAADADALAKDIAAHSAAKLGGCSLIVIDTLSRMLAGGTDAEPRDMALFLNNVEKLRAWTGAHILIVHHTGKDKDRGMRGSTALRDSADTVIEIAEPGETERRKATVVKQKDGEDGIGFAFRLNPIEIGTDEDGDPVTSCTVEYLDSEPSKGEAKKPNLSTEQRLALRALTTALSDHGRRDMGAPGGRVAVLIDRWREECRTIGMADDRDAAAFRQAFKRAKDGLQVKGAIGIERDVVWRSDLT